MKIWYDAGGAITSFGKSVGGESSFDAETINDDWNHDHYELIDPKKPRLVLKSRMAINALVLIEAKKAKRDEINARCRSIIHAKYSVDYQNSVNAGVYTDAKMANDVATIIHESNIAVATVFALGDVVSVVTYKPVFTDIGTYSYSEEP